MYNTKTYGGLVGGFLPDAVAAKPMLGLQLFRVSFEKPDCCDFFFGFALLPPLSMVLIEVRRQQRSFLPKKCDDFDVVSNSKNDEKK